MEKYKSLRDLPILSDRDGCKSLETDNDAFAFQLEITPYDFLKKYIDEKIEQRRLGFGYSESIKSTYIEVLNIDFYACGGWVVRPNYLTYNKEDGCNLRRNDQYKYIDDFMDSEICEKDNMSQCMYMGLIIPFYNSVYIHKFNPQKNDLYNDVFSVIEPHIERVILNKDIKNQNINKEIEVKTFKL